LHRYNAYAIPTPTDALEAELVPVAPSKPCSPWRSPATMTTRDEVIASRKAPAPKRDDLPPTTTACVKCGHALGGHHTLISGTGIGQRKCDEPGCRCPNKAPEYGR
jgi:hypothetical protein